MRTAGKIVQSSLDYISTPNIHFECFIFTSVTLHINVWYWKIWWASWATLPVFILHFRLWTQSLKFFLLTPTEDKLFNWGNANSVVTFLEFRKKQEHAFLKHSHTDVNCKTDFPAPLKALLNLNADYMLRSEKANEFSCFTNSNQASLGKDAVKFWKFFT